MDELTSTTMDIFDLQYRVEIWLGVGRNNYELKEKIISDFQSLLDSNEINYERINYSIVDMEAFKINFFPIGELDKLVPKISRTIIIDQGITPVIDFIINFYTCDKYPVYLGTRWWRWFNLLKIFCYE